MKIVDMRVHSIAIADPPLRSSYGLHAPYALRNVLELVSEDGIVGIAETYGGEQPAKALHDVRGRVIGGDAYRLTGLLLDLVEGDGAGLDARARDRGLDPRRPGRVGGAPGGRGRGGRSAGAT